MSAAFTFATPQTSEQPYTISQINDGISRIIESGNTLVWVEGELSNFKQASSGHCYLRLKDDSSQIPAVIWKQTFSQMKFSPQDGMQVLVIASIRVYQKGGYYQLDIHKMQEAGLGALYAAFLALKEKLEKEGLFDATRKKPIPATINRLGVLSSKQGAALFDIIKVVRSRSPRTDIVVLDIPVQGEAAPQRIVQAIETMNGYAGVDCIILGRGGGSIEDLWAFNDERVARAIFASKIPIVSAVGHEIDFTIADFVADLRAPTPSAAAEMIIPDDAENTRYFISLCQHMYGAFMSYFEACRQTHRTMARKMAWRQPQRLLSDASQTLDDFSGRAERAMRVFLDKVKSTLANAAGRLQALSPLGVMSRGYSIVSDKNGNTVKNADDLIINDQITIYFHTGKATADVKSKELS